MWKSGEPKYLLPELYCTVRNLEERFFKEAAERIKGIVGNKRLEETETYGKYQII